MALREILTSKIEESLAILSERLAFTNMSATTHEVVEIVGFQEVESIEALSTYFVALRAGIVDQAGNICSQLIDNTPDYANDILRSVDEIVIQPADSSENEQIWKSTWRNPWIAEGVWHCYMRIAMDRTELHTEGAIIAIAVPHVSAKDHGLDVTALYIKENGVLGISIVETKAYRDYPNQAISDAVTTLKDVEAGKHNTRLRQIVTSFRSIIGEPNKQQLSSSLWKNERILIPNPHYEASGATVQWDRERRSFSSLEAPVVIMPNAIDGFDEFFDDIASTMRSKAEELVANV